MRLRVFITVILLSLCGFSSTGFAQNIPKIRPSFKNDICLAAKLYMLSEVQNNVFIEPLIKRWKPYNDVLRFSGTARYQRRLQRFAIIGEPEEGATVSLSLIN
jgi:hypothetical protein